MSTTDVAVIGNGMFGALIDKFGRYVWCCLESFEGDPVFNCLLNNNSDKTGFYDVVLEDFERAEQYYISTSTVLVTRLHSSKGDSVEIRDFAPRFTHFERIFRPFQIFRVVRRLQGDPRISIRIRPTFKYNSTDGYQTRGSAHVRFCGPSHTWRATTNTSIRHILEEVPFLVPISSDPIYIVFGSDESFANSLQDVATDFEIKTTGYWRQWCCSLCLPVEFQEVLVRAAMTIGILQSEECGGFVSALTVGLPLGPLGGPTRETRVCRLLDECLSLPVLRDLGLFDMARKFLLFAKEACFKREDPQHTYNSCGSVQAKKRERASYLAGYRGMGEVHYGGQFIEHSPHDNTADRPASQAPLDASVDHTSTADAEGNREDEWHSRTVIYGLLVVTLTHAFFDIRLSQELCTPKLYEKLEFYALRAYEGVQSMAQAHRTHLDRAGCEHEKVGGSSLLSATERGERDGPRKPPCGASFFDDEHAFLIWQDLKAPGWDRVPTRDKTENSSDSFSERPSVHTLSSVLCWAAADRLRRLAAHFLRDANRANFWQLRASQIRADILRFAWSEKRGAFTTYWGGCTVGPSLLRLTEIGFLSSEDPKFVGTLRAFEKDAALFAVGLNAGDGNPVPSGDVLRFAPFGDQAILEASSACYMTNTLLWYCEALRSTGSVAECRRILEGLIGCSTHRGILTESVDLRSAEPWGNAPSVPALLSLLRIAPRLSRSWREI